MVNRPFHVCWSYLITHLVSFTIFVILAQGEFTKLGSLRKLKAGSIIRCEQKGHRWLVDGKLVASSLASDDTFHFENSFLPPTGHVNNGTKDGIIPCFSGKGVSRCIYIPFHYVCSETNAASTFATSRSALDIVANCTILPMMTTFSKFVAPQNVTPWSLL